MTGRKFAEALYFSLPTADHEVMPATTCTSCGYNAPWHSLDCTVAKVTFRCPEHAPAGVKAEPFDDGKERCDICGTFGGHVKPYRP